MINLMELFNMRLDPLINKIKFKWYSILAQHYQISAETESSIIEIASRNELYLQKKAMIYRRIAQEFKS